jgi:DNA modification methylase
VSLGDHGGQQRDQRRRRIQNDALPPEQWESFVRSWSRSLLQNVDGALYICMSSKEWPLVSRVLAEEGAHWSDTIIWAKDRFVLGRADYQRAYEPIWYGWREGVQHYWRGDRDQGDVWKIDRPTDNDLHPTMKPLPLIERALENSSQPGDVVLDLFLGSGSTLIAAERTGRVCYGVELEQRYVDVALLRWESFSGQRAVRA